MIGQRKIDCWKVKLYQLGAGGVWNDKGTGFVSCQHAVADRNSVNDNRVTYSASLVVRKEDDMSLLLQSPIQYEDAYERQGESIIMWRENCPETGQDIDYALSFQDTAGCFGIWESIMDVQSFNCTVSKSIEHDTFDIHHSPSPLGHELASTYIGLPGVSSESLEEIRDKVSSAFPSQKEVYASIILDQDGDYLRKILDMSVELEKAGDTKGCARIAEIVKGIVYLNDRQVLELILSEDVFPRIAGALEYDPLLRQKASYREILERSPTGPRCVIGESFGGPHMSSLVVKLFRVKLLKDIMIRPLLDETGAAAMNSMLYNLQSTVCTEVFSDTEYIRKVLEYIEGGDRGECMSTVTDADSTGLKSENGERSFVESVDSGTEAQSPVAYTEYLCRARDCLGLLRELFFMSRQMSLDSRNNLYTQFLTTLRGLFFSAISRALCRRRGAELALLANMRVMAAEILACVALVCPSFIRQCVIEGPVPQPPGYVSNSQTPRIFAHTPSGGGVTSSRGNKASNTPYVHCNDICLLFVIIERIICDEETAVVEHLGDALKTLLDPERLDKLDKERFLALFYDYYIQWMLVPFVDEDRLPDEGIDICPSRPDEIRGGDKEDIEQQPASLRSLQDISAISSSRRFLCEIFSLCVGGHTYRMKYFVMRNSAISRVLRLLQSSYKHLHICALKFTRAVIAIKDEFYHRHIVKFDILKPVFELFSRICTKDNLVTSTIVEIVNFIWEERIHSLVSYVVEKHKKDFVECIGKFDSLKPPKDCASLLRCDPNRPLHEWTFVRLIEVYEQMEESQCSMGTGSQQTTSSAGGNGTEGHTASVARMQQNRELAELESEEAYFYDDDSDSEEVYGPNPQPEGVAAEGGGRRSYFEGTVSSGSGRPAGGVISSSGMSGHSSVSLVSELCDDFDEDDGPTGPDSMGSADNNRGSPSYLSDPPLPPLRPKFESGVDEDIEDNIFTRKIPRQQQHNSGASGSRTSTTSVTRPQSSSGTISFSMKKKPRIL
mmetsp:Transcript_3864/g.6025  ORF Transcript_3864/g.6025 Transcript_3864/m.6025 type:complete len:1008 (-) Transcript_3864:216-3239(-)|eukprot:CAMPEP_0185030958 /NCGR_PEP_ID=MMETSP1103-20130426/18128_1 /TAXON_ID=36769 /ORGANISM="Paraphysomonas bandaiensis, Strain Caron Lab Isolate" /LENGTH=1007 /DNA_ID=CAMNT_0027566275 /DNA_START=146 /DNA_END=3169 /DNA_ORIENTATION=+